MPRKKYRQLSQNQLNENTQDVKRRADYFNSEYTLLKERFGSNGKMFEATNSFPAFPNKENYDNIKLDAQGKLSEDMVVAIMMGAALNPDRMSDHILTSSSAGGSKDILGFNSTCLMENMVGGDSRVGEFKELLPKARQEAKNAIEDFKNGKPEKAQKMVNDFLDAAIRSSRQYKLSDSFKQPINSNEVQSLVFASKIYGQPPFNCKGTGRYAETEVIKMINIGKSHEAMGKLAENRNKLINDPSAPNSSERKKLVEETLFNKFLTHINAVDIADSEKKRYEIYTKMLNDIGIETLEDEAVASTSDTLQGDLEDVKEVQIARGDIADTYRKYHVSDIQAILAKPDGVEKIHKLYHKAIVNSDRYKDLVEADNQKDITEMLNDMGEETLSKEYADVKVPEAAKEINKRCEKQYEKEMSAIRDNVHKAVTDTKFVYEKDAKDYGIAGLSKEDLEKNARIISGMYKTLTDNDAWYKTSSDEFKDVKESMKKLKTLSEKMAKKGDATDKELAEYDRLSQKTYELGGKYLDYKKVVDGDYAEGRVNAVQQLRRHLGTNLRSVRQAFNQREIERDDKLRDEMLDEMQLKGKTQRDNIKKADAPEEKMTSEEKAGAEIERWKQREEDFKKYDFGLVGSKARETFFGEKYKENDLDSESLKKQISTQRSAAHTLTIAILAKEGKGKYTMEQLLDPDMLKEEKKKTFDEVITKLKAGDRKWVAEQMYEGQKAVMGLINEAEKGIDISDPDLMYNKNTMMFQKLMNVSHDIWQEKTHFEQELMQFIKKDNPNMTYQEYSDYTNNASSGPLNDIINDKAKQITEVRLLRENPKLQSERGNPMVMHSIISKISQLRMNQLKEAKGNIPYTDRYTDEDRNRFQIDKFIARQNEGIQKKCTEIGESKDFNRISKKLLDGSALKDVQLIDHPDAAELHEQLEIKGIPTEKQLIADVKYEDMEAKFPGNLDKMKDKAVSKYENEKTFASPVHKTYLDKAKTAVTKLHDMIRNGEPLTGEKREDAVKCIKDIATEKFIGIMEKNGAKLPLASEEEIGKAVEKLPAFKKATEYIGTGTIGEFAFEGKAVEIVKESVADIQNNLKDIQAENARLKKQAQNERELQNGHRPPEHDIPKIEVPH